ncbi:MAG: alpha/beta fold hydrolase [bacterium]
MAKTNEMFTINGLNIHGLRWGNPNSKNKILALHGWLDNAASFKPLSPYFSDFDLLAYDMSGHGLSDHRSLDAGYHMVDFVLELAHIVNQLDWDNIVLLGHSMGGAIASLFCSTQPANISHLIVMDALGPMSGEPADSTQRLTRYIKGNTKTPGNKTFPSIELACKSLCKATHMRSQDAKILLERGLIQVDGGWAWRSDRRLLNLSPVRYTEEAVIDLLSSITTPSTIIASDPLPVFINQVDYKKRLDAFKPQFEHRVKAGHHLHMECPEQIAGLIKQSIQWSEQN